MKEIKTKFPFPKADVTLYENFFSERESDRLFLSLKNSIIWKQEKGRSFGREYDEPRLTSWYGNSGANYSYSGITRNTNSWNDDLILIKSKVEKEIGKVFTSCLLNFYRDNNDKVDWHQDNEKELGVNPIIASISFGARRNIQFRPSHVTSGGIENIYLNNGSLLLMKGTTQQFWKHKIPSSTKKIGPRINLTFRII